MGLVDDGEVPVAFRSREGLHHAVPVRVAVVAPRARVAEGLEVFGFYPNRKRLAGFALFFWVTACCSASFYLLRMMIGQERWYLNPELSAGDNPVPILGIVVASDYDFPFTVTIQLENVGGPSAGMMFALGIVDKLTPGSLNGVDACSEPPGAAEMVDSLACISRS